MPFKDPRTFLWVNVCELMGVGPDDRQPSIDAVKKRVGVGRGTVQRIKEQSAAAQLDSLTIIAGKLGVPVWRLLQPADEAPKAAPPHSLSAKALEVAHLYDQIDPDKKVLVEALAHALQRPVITQPAAHRWSEPTRTQAQALKTPSESAPEPPADKRAQ